MRCDKWVLRWPVAAVWVCVYQIYSRWLEVVVTHTRTRTHWRHIAFVHLLLFRRTHYLCGLFSPFSLLLSPLVAIVFSAPSQPLVKGHTHPALSIFTLLFVHFYILLSTFFFFFFFRDSFETLSRLVRESAHRQHTRENLSSRENVLRKLLVRKLASQISIPIVRGGGGTQATTTSAPTAPEPAS